MFTNSNFTILGLSSIIATTFIMTMLMLSKNLSNGFPSSPHWAMAIPVTTAKTTKPKMLVELDGKRIYRRGKLKACHGGAG